MNEIKKPTRELSFEEIIDQTFAVYSQKFIHYLTFFFIANIIINIIIITINSIIQIPPLPAQANTLQEKWNWLFNNSQTIIPNIALILIAHWIIINNITQAICVKFTSELLEKGQANFLESIHCALEKLSIILLASSITFALIIAGLVAFVIPGIVCSIIFSFTTQAIMIENSGALKSLSRSRLLLKHQWIKTLGLLFLIYIAIIATSLLISVITTPLGEIRWVINSIFIAFLQPLLPIGLTLHYYSTITKSNLQERTNIQ